MALGRRSARRRGMVMGAAIASSRAKKATPVAQPQPTSTASPAPTSEVEQLKQLAALRVQGILTDEVFTEKKKQLLGI